MDAITIGRRAEELLEDEVLAAAFTALEVEYTREWRRGKTPEDRERAWNKVHALEEVQRKLRAAVSNGEVEAAQLQTLHERVRE